MDSLIKEQIKFKVEDIDKLFSEYNLVFEKVKEEIPDLFYMIGIGAI